MPSQVTHSLVFELFASYFSPLGLGNMSHKLARKLAWKFEKMAWMWEFPSETTRQVRTGTFWHCYPSYGIPAVCLLQIYVVFLDKSLTFDTEHHFIMYATLFTTLFVALLVSQCCKKKGKQKTTVHLLQIWKGMCLLPSEHSSSGGYVINRRVREELQELGAQWIIRGLWKSPHKMVGLFNHPW